MTIPSTPATLSYLRDNARSLLNEFDAADALASYYALHHDPKRTTLFMHRDQEGMVDGFLARCQTGFDLFRPLVTLRMRGLGALPDLLSEGLVPARPYLMVVPSPILERIAPYVTFSEVTHNLILRLDPTRFRPEVNVLVTTRHDPDGHPRAEIRQGAQVIATAGINWRSPVFAEVFVNVQEGQREQGYGRAVIVALVTELMKLKVAPIYAVAENNPASYEAALRAGFVDTGAREVMGQAVRVSSY
ncbi:MAG: hypothetical protein JXB07_12490 [Anaerolineae bacterium]|nr:hypothetical protein [Anaerolineae bacterium]